MRKTYFILFFFTFLGNLCNAYSQVINKGDVFISQKSVLKFSSPFVNEGVFYNDGTVWFANDFKNHGAYDYLENQENLTIFRAKNALNIQGKPLFLGSVLFDTPYLSLSTDLYISHFADFHKGIVSTSNRSMLFFGPTADSYSNRKSYFTGMVQKENGNQFTYPIGKNNTYTAVIIEEIDSNEFVGVQYQIGKTENLLVSQKKEQSIIQINPDEYWNIDVSNKQSVNIIELPFTSNTDLSIVDINSKYAVLFLDGDQWIPVESILNQSETGLIANIKIGGIYTFGVISSNESTSPEPTPVIDIVVYQGITANNDGANDYLIIENINKYPENKVSVFNRSGQEIFSTQGYDNLSNFWDGTYKGKRLHGTFFYVVQYKDGKGKIKEKTGFIHVK